MKHQTILREVRNKWLIQFKGLATDFINEEIMRLTKIKDITSKVFSLPT
jgi:hypothetical protein